ncbi:MAG: 16S rRNA (cytosine(1402)-N(4))-methyltransferase RsmH, partial [Planctomycetota bacterium]
MTPDGETAHIPVLSEELLRLLDPAPGARVLDLTVGAGGHSAAILARLQGQALLVGVDRDASALAVAAGVLGSHETLLLRGDFGDLAPLRARFPVPSFDCILADLGVSSMQLDEPSRGFSFRRGGPLDMRMDRGQEGSALELVHECTVNELTRIILDYGEERHAARVARAIDRSRQEGRITTTSELASVVRGALPKQRRGGVDPATRTFQ